MAPTVYPSFEPTLEPTFAPTLVPTDSFLLTTSVTLSLSGLSSTDLSRSSVLQSALQDALAAILGVPSSYVTIPVVILKDVKTSFSVVKVLITSEYNDGDTAEMITDNTPELLSVFVAYASKGGYVGSLSSVHVVNVVTATLAPTAAPSAEPTLVPSAEPTAPTFYPTTLNPTVRPTHHPIVKPTFSPTFVPTDTFLSTISVTITLYGLSSTTFSGSSVLQSALRYALAELLGVSSSSVTSPILVSKEPKSSSVIVKLVATSNYDVASASGMLTDSVKDLVLFFTAYASKGGYSENLSSVNVVNIMTETLAPTAAPTMNPTREPTEEPSPSPTLVPTESYLSTTSVTVTLSGLSYVVFSGSSVLQFALQNALAELLNVPLLSVTTPVIVSKQSKSSVFLLTLLVTSNYDCSAVDEIIKDNFDDLKLFFEAYASKDGYDGSLSSVSISNVLTTTASSNITSVSSKSSLDDTNSENHSSLLSLAAVAQFFAVSVSCIFVLSHFGFFRFRYQEYQQL